MAETRIRGVRLTRGASLVSVWRRTFTTEC